MKQLLKIGLIPRIIIAIALGILLGAVLNTPWVRVFVTFNNIFSSFLGFSIPLIILSMVSVAIGNIGKGAGKMLLLTVLIAYLSTVFAGVFSYLTGSVFFDNLIQVTPEELEKTKAIEELSGYFSINIAPPMDVMTSLVLAFVLGLGMSALSGSGLKTIMKEFEEIIIQLIAKVIIPLLPFYIFGIFLNMTYQGQVLSILALFIKIILVIFAIHICILLLQFCIAGILTKRNPLRLLWRMMPAYVTALGTQSSAATIPVTLKQTLSNGVSPEIAGFVIPLCATIHLSGSTLKIVACALALMIMHGMPHDFTLFFGFICMLGVTMVAAPGVPGGAIMACLGILGSILHFDAQMQALMIALYITMDNFGTACNVTGDGSIAIIVDRIMNRKKDRLANLA